MTLEETLADLSWYGLPLLSKSEKGWWCKIEVFVTGAGVQFKVESDFGMPTPLDAAADCQVKLMAALGSLTTINKEFRK